MNMTTNLSVLYLAILMITFLDRCCASSEDGSGMDTPQEMTTLQYCVVDNSTIIRLDTGEQLDVVYTRNSSYTYGFTE